MNGNGFSVRRQNVSIGIDYNSDQIDLVPARRQSQYGNDHSLYVSKKNSWIKTNIDTHISQVSNSNRLNEIKLVKIWRNANNLDFPSFYLELVVIDALYNRTTGATELNRTHRTTWGQIFAYMGSTWGQHGVKSLLDS